MSHELWTSKDLVSWMDRHKLNAYQAAAKLNLPYATFAEYLPNGRHRKEHLPRWLPVLCRSIELLAELINDFKHSSPTVGEHVDEAASFLANLEGEL